MRFVALLLLLLAACSKPAVTSGAAEQVDLERAAIAAGVVRDPADTDLTGLYARETDKVCIVPDLVGYRIGALVDYGEGQACAGAGRVTRSGETLHVEFDGAAGCSIEARFDGERIDFPGRVPAACAKLCSARASLAALSAALQSNAIAEARTLRDPRGKALCDDAES